MTENLVDKQNSEVFQLDNSNDEGFMQSLLNKFSEYQMYVYIGIAVVVIGVVLYYFYYRNQKETMTSTDKDETTNSKSEYKQENKDPTREITSPSELLNNDYCV